MATATKAKRTTKKTPAKRKPATAATKPRKTTASKATTPFSERDQWLVIGWTALIAVFLAFVIKVYVVG